jgi:hypothetical protein
MSNRQTVLREYAIREMDREHRRREPFGEWLARVLLLVTLVAGAYGIFVGIIIAAVQLAGVIS